MRKLKKWVRNDGKSDPILDVFSRMNDPKVIPNSILQLDLEYIVSGYWCEPKVQIQSFGLDFIFDYNVPLFRKIRELHDAIEVMKILPQGCVPEYYKKVMDIRKDIERMSPDPIHNITLEGSNEEEYDSDFKDSDTEEEVDPGYNEMEPLPKRRRVKRREQKNLY